MSQARSLIEQVAQGADPSTVVAEKLQRSIAPTPQDSPKEMGLDLSEYAVSAVNVLQAYHDIFAKKAGVSGEVIRAYDKGRLATSAAIAALRTCQGAGDALFQAAKRAESEPGAWKDY